MGKHSGAVAVDRGPLRKRFLLLLAGTLATLVAWGYLVWKAIDFGGQARDTGGLAWVFLLMATLGATACLFMTLVLGGKLLAIVRGPEPDPARPATPPGGRRAKR